MRGPARAFRSQLDFNDFISPYVQTKVWLQGQNPYDLDVLARAWPFQRPSLKPALVARGIPSPYPITGFPLLAPLAALSWSKANMLLRIAQILSFMLFLASLLSIARTSAADSSRNHLIALATLAFAPFHTALSVENLALVALALATAAIACEPRSRIAAGFCLLAGWR